MASNFIWIINKLKNAGFWFSAVIFILQKLYQKNILTVCENYFYICSHVLGD